MAVLQDGYFCRGLKRPLCPESAISLSTGLFRYFASLGQSLQLVLDGIAVNQGPVFNDFIFL
jgi:hypothetical protein